MATKRDYYEILGISKQASKDEIKRAYKKLAIKHHPDKGGDAEKFKELSEAYAALSDDTKRRTYDQFGHAGFDQRYSQEDIFRGVNFDEIFQDVFGGAFGGGIFESFFGGRRQRRGQDLRFDLEISFEEAAFGVDKKIRIPKLVECGKCRGTGAESGSMVLCEGCHGSGQVRRATRTVFGTFTQISDCRKCNGYGQLAEKRCKGCHEGLVQENKEIAIHIPGGIESGSRLRVRGEGEGIARGPAGDLYVVVHVQPHEIFERNGFDVVLNFPVSFSQAALGGQIEVPTLKEKVKMKIPAGCQTHTIFRLRGRGMRKLQNEDFGDQLVRVIVKTPTKLNRKQEDLLQQLAGENKEKLKIEKGFFEKVRDVFV